VEDVSAAVELWGWLLSELVVGALGESSPQADRESARHAVAAR